MYCRQQCRSDSLSSRYDQRAFASTPLICSPHSDSCSRNLGFRQSFCRILMLGCWSAILSKRFMRVATSGRASLHFSRMLSSNSLLERLLSSIESGMLVYYNNTPQSTRWPRLLLLPFGSTAILNYLCRSCEIISLTHLSLISRWWWKCFIYKNDRKKVEVGLFGMEVRFYKVNSIKLTKVTIYISLQLKSEMSHLQNKSYVYQQIQTRARECAITRSRYKMMEKKAEPEVYYSDEEDSNSHQKNQFEDIIKQAQGQIQRTQVKEEPNASTAKLRKTRAQMKKKASKGKNHAATPPTNILDPAPTPNIPPIPEEAHQSPEPISPQSVQPIQVQPQKPYFNHQISFRTIQQSQLNRLECVKNRIDKKYAATHKIKRLSLIQKNPFHFVPDYRAYFEKEAKSSYEEYQQSHSLAVQKAITSKVNQLAKLQKDTKHQLLKRLQQQRFRFKKNTSKVIQTIAEVSCNLDDGVHVDKSIISAACASNLNEQFPNINQFLASNHSFINQQQQINKNDRASKTSQSVTIPPPNAESDQQMGGSREKRRKDRPRGVEGSVLEEQSNDFQIRQASKHLDLEQLHPRNNFKKIMATIEIVNKQCAQDEKHRIIESERLEQEREERQRAKMAKKEQQSNISSPYEPSKNEAYDENESERKRLESLKGTDWYNYHGKSNPKIKRLEILNRYHYNPFEENEGEDQCELWKKLMSIQIKNIKSENPSIKNEDFNNNLVDELYKVAEFSDNAKNNKNIPHNDVFILPTNYKPQEVDKKNKEEEQEALVMSFEKEKEKEKEVKQKERKTKPCKKQKKSHKSKKERDSREDKDSKSGFERENREASNNQPEIDDFLNLGPKEECPQFYQPKLEYMGHYAPASLQAEPENNLQAIVHQSFHNNNNEPTFNFDQLPALEGFENVKHDDRPDDDEPLFQSDAPLYRDIEYFEGLASKQKN